MQLQQEQVCQGLDLLPPMLRRWVGFTLGVGLVAEEGRYFQLLLQAQHYPFQVNLLVMLERYAAPVVQLPDEPPGVMERAVTALRLPCYSRLVVGLRQLLHCVEPAVGPQRSQLVVVGWVVLIIR